MNNVAGMMTPFVATASTTIPTAAGTSVPVWRVAGWVLVLVVWIGSGRPGAAQRLELAPVRDTDEHTLQVVRADTTVELVTAQRFRDDEPETGFYAYGWSSPGIIYAAWVSQTARRAIVLSFYDVHTQKRVWRIVWGSTRRPIALFTDPNTGALTLATNRLLEIAQHGKYISMSPGIHQVGLCMLGASTPTLVTLPLVTSPLTQEEQMWIDRRLTDTATRVGADGNGLEARLPALVDVLPGAAASRVQETTGRCAVGTLTQSPQRTDDGRIRLQGRIALGDTTGTHVMEWTADVDSARIALRRVERVNGSDLAPLRDSEGLRSMLRESVRAAFDAVGAELQMKWSVGDAHLGGAFFSVDGGDDRLALATRTGLRVDLKPALTGYYETDVLDSITPLHVSQQAGRLYMLMSVGRASRPGATSGRCAAGEEHDLVWLAFDASRTLVNHALEPYQSCLSGLELVHPPAPMLRPEDVNGTRLDVGVMDLDGEERHLFYDTTAPSRGIQRNTRTAN